MLTQAMSLPGFFPSAVVVYAVLKQVSKLPVRYAICGTDRALHYQSKNVSALAQLGSIGQVEFPLYALNMHLGTFQFWQAISGVNVEWVLPAQHRTHGGRLYGPSP